MKSQAECSHGSHGAHEKLVGEILVAITPFARAWRNPTGVAWQDGQPVRFGLIGSSDILGLLRGGIFLAIEVKTGNARQSPQQIKFQAMVELFGGKYLVARDVASAVEFVRKHAR